MRLLTLLLSGLSALGLAIAQTNNQGGVQYQAPDLTKLPTCGLMCLIKVAPVAGCGLTDYACMCHSQKFIDMATKCTLANCTVEQSFVVVKEQATLCQYKKESKNTEIRVVIVALAIITKILVPLRLGLRWFSQGSFGWDDWLIIGAFATDTVAFYAAMKIIDNGLGEHIWMITPANLDQFVLWSYIVLTMYIVTNGLVKISVLAFYLRIFTVSKRFRYLCWINIVFCAMTAVTFVFVNVFQCVPVSNTFLLVPKDGYCINLGAATWAHSGLTVLQDFIVVVLPITEVIALQMSLRRKIGVSFIFVLGSLVVVASILRMFQLKNFGRTADPTWTNQPTTLWSSIELGIGFICACIPGIYSGLRAIYPNCRAFTQRYITQTGSKHSVSHSRNGRRTHPSGSHHGSKNAQYSSSSTADEGYHYKSDGSIKNPAGGNHNQKRRFRSASMDLPLTEISAYDHDSDSNAGHELTRLESIGEMEKNKVKGAVISVDRDKPQPPLPLLSPRSMSRASLREREQQQQWRGGGMGGIETVTTVTVVEERVEGGGKGERSRRKDSRI